MWKCVLLMNIPCNNNRRDLYRSASTPQSNAIGVATGVLAMLSVLMADAPDHQSMTKPRPGYSRPGSSDAERRTSCTSRGGCEHGP